MKSFSVIQEAMLNQQFAPDFQRHGDANQCFLVLRIQTKANALPKHAIGGNNLCLLCFVQCTTLTFFCYYFLNAKMNKQFCVAKKSMKLTRHWLSCAKKKLDVSSVSSNSRFVQCETIAFSQFCSAKKPVQCCIFQFSLLVFSHRLIVVQFRP